MANQRPSTVERQARGSVRPLNPTAASLLGLLHAGDLSGYELNSLAQLFLGDFWTLTRSQVYRELGGLAERGYVEARARGSRSKRPYRLTDDGRAAFEDWVAQPPGTEQIRYPLLLTIAFGAWLGPERLLDFAADHRSVHERRLAGYLEISDDAASGRDAYAQATLAFGIHYERAVLAWMDELPAILARARAGG